MPSQRIIRMKSIGYVSTKAVGDDVKDKSQSSRIVIQEEFLEALEGLTEFSHVYVLFWMNQIDPEQRSIMKVHPRGRRDLPLIGVFATRTNHRPNPIGLTLVELLKLEANVLTVRGLDAFDGTPILDIKPFDYWDKAEDARVPEWWLQLERERTNRNKL